MDQGKAISALEKIDGECFGEWGGKVEAGAGVHIANAIREAIMIAGEMGEPFHFDFNGVAITVLPDSDADLIYRDWSRAVSGYIGGAVGPRPNPTLTDEEAASDARIESDNERRREELRAKYEREQSAKKKAADIRIENAGPLQITDRDAWQMSLDANKDEYGGAVMAYAERWALLMQSEIVAGKSLSEIADSTSHDAGVEGITGFMYGAAVSILAKCWAHGDELRRWHNKDVQIGDEGDRANQDGSVLNPGLLSTGSK